MAEIRLTLNGDDETFEARKSDLLLDLLRRNGYTGAKRGCDTGACGFCTVLVDGEPRQSCVLPVTRVEGSEVETVEGLGSQDDLHPVQQAFVDHSALQCGFCIPGMVMSATALLAETTDPSEAEVREALEGNLCRCTGYKKIVEAVMDAADRMEPSGPAAADGGVPAGDAPEDVAGDGDGTPDLDLGRTYPGADDGSDGPREDAGGEDA